VGLAVQKTLAFEQAPAGQPGRERVLAIADGQDGSFKSDAQAFLDPLVNKFSTELVAPDAGVQSGSAAIVKKWEAGQRLVAYFGHGGVTLWGKDQLFSSDEATGLQNGPRLPVVFNFTCLVGLFSHPKVESLAEALLWAPNGGAAAVLAPTSLTQPTDQSFLSQPLADSLASGKQKTLGEALLAAWQSIPPGSEGGQDVARTFLLFGDPALAIP
jgi:hypothetical protein